MEKVDSCRDGRELFRIAKQRVREKKNVVGLVGLKMKVRMAKVSVDD